MCFVPNVDIGILLDLGSIPSSILLNRPLRNSTTDAPAHGNVDQWVRFWRSCWSYPSLDKGLFFQIWHRIFDLIGSQESVRNNKNKRLGSEDQDYQEAGYGGCGHGAPAPKQSQTQYSQGHSQTQSLSHDPHAGRGSKYGMLILFRSIL